MRMDCISDSEQGRVWWTITTRVKLIWMSIYCYSLQFHFDDRAVLLFGAISTLGKLDMVSMLACCLYSNNHSSIMYRGYDIRPSSNGGLLIRSSSDSVCRHH